jgi:hypothetical protein
MATNQVFVYTMNRGVNQGAWSRYIFPWNIEHFSHLQNTLYMRHGDFVSYAIHDGLYDDGVPFDGVIQWPWLDFGAPGVNKMLIGFDIIGEGTSSIEIGYDQTSPGFFTTSYPVPVDTYPGEIVGFPLMAPSMSIKLTYDGGQAWQWNALNLYLADMREGS